jgi:hypothetical protein
VSSFPENARLVNGFLIAWLIFGIAIIMVWLESHDTETVQAWESKGRGVSGVVLSRGGLFYCSQLSAVHPKLVPGFARFRLGAYAGKIPVVLDDGWTFSAGPPELITLRALVKESEFAGFRWEVSGHYQAYYPGYLEPGKQDFVASHPPPNAAAITPDCWTFVVPSAVVLGILAAFAGVPAASLARLLWRKYAQRRGYCAKCGYDLRASPRRCPECGLSRRKREPRA